MTFRRQTCGGLGDGSKRPCLCGGDNRRRRVGSDRVWQRPGWLWCESACCCGHEGRVERIRVLRRDTPIRAPTFTLTPILVQFRERRLELTLSKVAWIWLRCGSYWKVWRRSKVVSAPSPRDKDESAWPVRCLRFLGLAMRQSSPNCSAAGSVSTKPRWRRSRAETMATGPPAAVQVAALRLSAGSKQESEMAAVADEAGEL